MKNELINKIFDLLHSADISVFEQFEDKYHIDTETETYLLKQTVKELQNIIKEIQNLIDDEYSNRVSMIEEQEANIAELTELYKNEKLVDDGDYNRLTNEELKEVKAFKKQEEQEILDWVRSLEKKYKIDITTIMWKIEAGELEIK